MFNRLAYLWPYLRPHRRKLMLGILAIVAGVGLGLVSPLLVGKAIDCDAPPRSSGRESCWAMPG